jgi:excisionase family DNA binding protein
VILPGVTCSALEVSLNANFKPLAVRRKSAAQALGVGVSKIDLLISNGTIMAVKSGKCLLIPTSELERYVASLPRAVLNMGRGKRNRSP